MIQLMNRTIQYIKLNRSFRPGLENRTIFFKKREKNIKSVKKRGDDDAKQGMAE